jgi:hypothetical protein
VVILLMAIGGYSISGYCGYSSNDYSWLFYYIDIAMAGSLNF